MLLVDDVQFLERKARTEEEFFHTFNALHEAGSQLVLTSDRLPRDLGALEDRLRERFEAGLVADIQPPDRATRLTDPAQARPARRHRRSPTPRRSTSIADRVTANVRALEGALIRVVAFGSLTGRPVTAELAAEVLDGLYPRRAAPGAQPAAAPIARGIQAAVCEAFGLTPRGARSPPSRAARVAWPRQVAMYLARELTGETLPAIGRAFGGRNHTTVMHACRRTAERMAQRPGRLRGRPAPDRAPHRRAGVTTGRA